MPASARTSDLKVLVAGGAIVIALGAASFLLAPGANLPRDSGSSHAVDPTGARAAFTLLETLGYDVRRSFEPLTALRDEPSHATLVLADPTTRPSRLDMARLTRFVELGGMVLAAGDAAVPFLPNVERWRGRAREQATDARSYSPAYPSPLAAGVQTVKMTAASHLRLGAEWFPVYGTFDDPAVLVARIGAGRIVWWASSEPLSNLSISEPGNAELFMNAIGPAGRRRVLWDEYYHGHARSFWSYVAGTPVAWGAAQCLAVAVAALLTVARRREPVRPVFVTPRTSPLEFIDTMAVLYRRSHAAADAVATALGRVRRLVAVSSGLAGVNSDERLAAGLERRHGLDASATMSTLQRAKSVSEKRFVEDVEGLSLVRELHDLEQVIQGRASRGRWAETTKAARR
jgi:hypothetical protein